MYTDHPMKLARAEIPLDALFSVVDITFERAPEEARAVLEGIVEIDPDNRRARSLLDRLEPDQLAPYDLRVAHVDELLRSVMEAAETLASEGLFERAWEIVGHVEKRYASSDEAKAWLDGIGLLLE